MNASRNSSLKLSPLPAYSPKFGHETICNAAWKASVGERSWTLRLVWGSGVGSSRLTKTSGKARSFPELISQTSNIYRFGLDVSLSGYYKCYGLMRGFIKPWSRCSSRQVLAVQLIGEVFWKSKSSIQLNLAHVPASHIGKNFHFMSMVSRTSALELITLIGLSENGRESVMYGRVLPKKL